MTTPANILPDTMGRVCVLHRMSERSLGCAC